MHKLNDGLKDEEDLISTLRICKERIIKLKENFIFRNHYVRLILL